MSARGEVTSGQETRDVQVDGATQQLVLPIRPDGKKVSKGRSDETGQIEVEVQLATTPPEKNKLMKQKSEPS